MRTLDEQISLLKELLTLQDSVRKLVKLNGWSLKQTSANRIVVLLTKELVNIYQVYPTRHV